MKDKQKIKILAQSIYALVSQKPSKGGLFAGQKGAEGAVKKFQNYLREHHLQNLLPQIIKELDELYKKDKEIVGAKVYYRQKPSAEIIAKIKKMLEHKTSQKVELELCPDEKMVGGIKIKYADRVIDLSLDLVLRELNKQLVN